MKSLALFAILLSACSPEATTLCEAKVECGLATTVDSCLVELRAERDMAAERDCDDEYYEMLDCQVDVDLTCGVDFDAQFQQTCAQSMCRYKACQEFPAGMFPPELCSMQQPPPLPSNTDAVGTWQISLTPPPQTCGPLAYDKVYIYVSDTAQLSSSDFNVTGSVSSTSTGSSLQVTLTGASRVYMLDLFAAKGATTITGTGRGTYSDSNGQCDADVEIDGVRIRN